MSNFDALLGSVTHQCELSEDGFGRAGVSGRNFQKQIWSALFQIQNAVCFCLGSRVQTRENFKVGLLIRIRSGLGALGQLPDLDIRATIPEVQQHTMEIV